MPHPTSEMHAVNFRTYVTEFPIYQFNNKLNSCQIRKSNKNSITSDNQFVGEPTGEYCTRHGNKPRHHIEYPSFRAGIVLLEVGWQPSEQNVVGIILTHMSYNERPKQRTNLNDRDIIIEKYSSKL